MHLSVLTMHTREEDLNLKLGTTLKHAFDPSQTLKAQWMADGRNSVRAQKLVAAGFRAELVATLLSDLPATVV